LEDQKNQSPCRANRFGGIVRRTVKPCQGKAKRGGKTRTEGDKKNRTLGGKASRRGGSERNSEPSSPVSVDSLKGGRWKNEDWKRKKKEKTEVSKKLHFFSREQPKKRVQWLIGGEKREPVEPKKGKKEQLSRPRMAIDDGTLNNHKNYHQQKKAERA